MFKQEGLPRGPDWQAVRRLIATTGEGSNPQDIRDHAMVVYGLRSGEVARLRLEDVDWEHEILSQPVENPPYVSLTPAQHCAIAELQAKFYMDPI